MTAPVKIGDVIDNKYKVEGILGEGGMGVVVAALHLELDSRVALKFLLPEAFSNMEAMHRFVREGRAAAKIKSEHVARIFDTGRLNDGSPFQVMELLEGEDLARVLSTRGAVAAEDAVSYVLQACEALAEAHAAGIVHRDLKPANLFLARQPDRTTILKVLDFGISKNISGSEKGLTRSNAVVGSPFYMSPEQLTYGREVDARTDIWSIGIILYELLSGTTPFNGETLPQVVAGILLNKPRMVGELRPGLPPALNAAISRCMRTEPNERFSSVAELAHVLVPYGPPSARESAERISRVLHLSYPPALGPTMADDGALPTLGAVSRSHSGLSGTAAPWARTGSTASGTTSRSAATSKGTIAAVIAMAVATLAAVIGGVSFLLVRPHALAPETARVVASSPPLPAPLPLPDTATAPTTAPTGTTPPAGTTAGAATTADAGLTVATTTPSPSAGSGSAAGHSNTHAPAETTRRPPTMIQPPTSVTKNSKDPVQ